MREGWYPVRPAQASSLREAVREAEAQDERGGSQESAYALSLITAVAADGLTLLARLQADQAAARKTQEKSTVLLLGMVISELKNREIELRRDATDDDTAEVIRKAIKKRREAVDMYQKASRQDLADQENREAEALEAYLPANVDGEVIRAFVRSTIAAGATTIGAVMGRVMPEFKGRADGNVINTIVREELARA